MTAPSVCPNCGSELKRDAIACRECGSDFKTGWKSYEDAQHDSVELPEDDYNEFLEREGLRKPKPSGSKVGFVIVAVILLFALILGTFL